jgi:glyoxylase-like metal-dependent hydrolase (beta-lactamase superfamily II)
MEIAPNIYHFETGPFNWYLMREGNRLTLVDAGFPGHYHIFLAGLCSIGCDLKDVEAIILTHAHADHTGFAEYLHRTTNVPIFVHGDDRASIGRVLQLPWYGLLSNAWRPPIVGMFVHAIGNGIFTMPHITKAYSFKDSDVLDVPGSPHVIHIPGHTRGEVAFHLPEAGVLFSGDTIITRDFLTGKGGQPQIPNHILNDNDKEARQSIDCLRKLGYVTVLPGHGQPWTGTMAEAIEIAHQTSAK